MPIEQARQIFNELKPPPEEKPKPVKRRKLRIPAEEKTNE